MRELNITSCSGSELHCGIWASTNKPRAILQVVHGIAEHIARYDTFGSYLASQGIMMVAHDHQGHGKSCAEGETLGYFPNGWRGAVEDTHSVMCHVRAEQPDIPYFLMGHSMGSFVVRTFLYRYPESKIDGAIISGTAWQPGIALTFGQWLCEQEAKKTGERGTSELVHRLLFGGNNKKFKPTRTENDWLTRDEAVVDAYCADPLCGFRATVGLSRDMLGGIAGNQRRENLQAMNKALPVFFFAGANDPVGNMGRGVTRSAQEFQKAGMTDVTCKLYPGGRHEMLNETNKEVVFLDVLNWISKKLSK